MVTVSITVAVTVAAVARQNSVVDRSLVHGTELVIRGEYSQMRRGKNEEGKRKNIWTWVRVWASVRVRVRGFLPAAEILIRTISGWDSNLGSVDRV